MKKHTMHRPVLLLLAACLAPGFAWAQDAAKSTATVATASATDEELIVLSPFEVSTNKDKGYRATNSTSGTRLNTPIKDVPLNLSVITNDFMRDTGATNLREAMRYEAGAVLESQSDAFVDMNSDPQGNGVNDPRGATRRAGDSSLKLRGFVIDQVLRDGFRRQYSADWINIGRVDVIRGPSALLYGVGSLGGVINYTPKAPEYQQSEYMGVTVGTDDFLRAEFDSTGPMGSSSWKPAYRVTGSFHTRGNFTEYYNEKHYTINPVFSFRPFKNTQVLIDTEFGYKKEVGTGFQNIRSNDGAPSREATWLTNDAGGSVNARTFRWSGEDTYLKGPFRNLVFDIKQRISENFNVKVGVANSQAVFDSRSIDASTRSNTFSNEDYKSYYQNYFVNLGGASYSIRDAMLAANTNGTFTAGTTAYTATQLAALAPAASYRGTKLYATTSNQNFSSTYVAGAPKTVTNAVVRYEWKDYNKTENRNQVRADAVYELDAGSWGKHKLITGVQYMAMENNESEFGPAYSYDNKFGTKYVADVDRFSYKSPRDLTTFKYGRQGDGLPDAKRVHLRDLDHLTWDMGAYAVYQGQFWKDRITFIGGLRHDRSDVRITTKYRYESTRPAEVQSRGALDTKGDESAPTASSPQAGISIKITNDLSIFGVYSTGAVPNPYSFDGNGKMFAPTKATNLEAGVKFDLWEGRISGTASVYQIKRKDQPYYIWWAPSPYESTKKGADVNAPTTTVWRYAHPDALGQAIFHTPGMTVAAAAALARQIFPASIHPMINEIAAIDPTTVPAQGAGSWGSVYSTGPLASQFWNWAGAYEGNSDNPPPGYTGTDYWPLVNLSDPATLAFMDATAAWGGGWWGNRWYTAGQTYRYGNGSTAKGNTPDGNGASVPMDDKATGWDISLLFSPMEDLTIVAGFAHVEREITSRSFKFVKAPYYPYGWWMQSDDNFGTYNSKLSAAQVYGNVTDSSTYNATTPYYGQPGDDTPANTASLWVRCGMKLFNDSLKKWTVGFGGNWEDRRMFYNGFLGGGGNVTLAADGTRRLVTLYTPDRFTYNMLIEYNTKISDKYDLRVALNGNNVLDDQGRYGLVYAPGATYQLSCGLKF